MNTCTPVAIRRRDFLSASSLMLFGSPFLDAAVPPAQSTPRGRDLPDELSPAEIELVNNSAMAKGVADYFGRGYSCAESGLAVGIDHLGKSSDLIWLAGGFGGGLNQRDLCGFLTGSIMAIGLYAGGLPLERKEARGVCTGKVKEFWSWWLSTAPLHCAEIREGRRDLKVCHRLGRLAAARLEGLIS